MFKGTIEVLAPAGSMESAIAAVNCGADAVYLGAKDFNARKNADNFTDDEFFEIVSYCHERGVKVYQTLNTIVYDDELPRLLDTIELSCKTGVDALIVQDLAVYKIVRECCPEMPLHASTQMSVHTLSGAQTLKEMGYERVVLSREMSEREIADVTKNCDIETEVFVHGALCMCVSGQCYLSAMIGQRSGNRGLCAQPCRLPFSSNDEKGRCDLSLKDLSLIGQIDALKNVGVTSLKIEGRMKRPEYVAAAVTACRQAVDVGHVDADIAQKLSDVFSRSGFTDGYFRGALGANMFGTRRHDDVLAADNKTLKSLAALFQKTRKCVGLDLRLALSEDGTATLTANDGVNEVQAVTDQAVKALKLPCDEESALKNLSKTGDTPYYITNLKVENDAGMMLAISQLNALRREVLEKISDIRREPKSVRFERNVALPVLKKRSSRTPAMIARCQTLSQVPTDKLDILKAVSLPLTEIDDEAISVLGNKLIMELPRVKFGTESAVLSRMKEVVVLGCRKAIISNIGDIALCSEAGITPIGGFGLNVTNSLALKEYSDLGVKSFTVSPELLLSKIAHLNKGENIGVLAYGSLPLMITRNCPIRNTISCDKCKGHRVLTDRRGAKFPVRCGWGYSEVLNSAQLYLGDRVIELDVCDFIVLYFTDESKTQVSDIIDEYTLRHTKREGITRGLYYRGSI